MTSLNPDVYIYCTANAPCVPGSITIRRPQLKYSSCTPDILKDSSDYHRTVYKLYTAAKVLDYIYIALLLLAWLWAWWKGTVEQERKIAVKNSVVMKFLKGSGKGMGLLVDFIEFLIGPIAILALSIPYLKGFSDMASPGEDNDKTYFELPMEYFIIYRLIAQ